MNGFLEKPIDPEKLKKTLGNVNTSSNQTINIEPEASPKTVLSETEYFNSETLDTLREHLELNEIKEMINDLVTKSSEIIDNIQIALEKNDTEALNHRAHELKGMTGNFGLLELSEIAGELETKAKRDEAILVLSSIISTIPEAQKRAEKALSRWINKNA